MLTAAGEIARWALVAVFAASLAHKAADPRGFAKGAAALLGASGPVVGVLAVLSGAAEAALIASLLFAGAAVVPYAAAVAVLLTYSAAISLALRRRNRVPCACFHGSGAVRGADLVRNGLLVALAGLGAAGVAAPGPAMTRPAQVVAVVGGLLVGAALTQVSKIMGAIDGAQWETA